MKSIQLDFDPAEYQIEEKQDEFYLKAFNCCIDLLGQNIISIVDLSKMKKMVEQKTCFLIKKFKKHCCLQSILKMMGFANKISDETNKGRIKVLQNFDYIVGYKSKTNLLVRVVRVKEMETYHNQTLSKFSNFLLVHFYNGLQRCRGFQKTKNHSQQKQNIIQNSENIPNSIKKEQDDRINDQLNVENKYINQINLRKQQVEFQQEGQGSFSLQQKDQFQSHTVSLESKDILKDESFQSILELKQQLNCLQEEITYLKQIISRQDQQIQHNEYQERLLRIQKNELENRLLQQEMEMFKVQSFYNKSKLSNQQFITN